MAMAGAGLGPDRRADQPGNRPIEPLDRQRPRRQQAGIIALLEGGIVNERQRHAPDSDGIAQEIVDDHEGGKHAAVLSAPPGSRNRSDESSLWLAARNLLAGRRAPG